MNRALKPIALGFIYALLKCSGNSVSQQSTAANVIAVTFNRTLPVWVRAAELDCSARVSRASNRAHAIEEFQRCESQWNHVAIAWESARVAHDVWRAEIDRCRNSLDASVDCTYTMRNALQNFQQALTPWRCAMRALGRADIDVFPSQINCATLDAGR